MIQYRDDNIGPANYKHLEPDQLLVTKIFYTLQGEGPLAGKPAVFVRLAGCNRGDKENMGCAFCDTDFRFANGTAMSFTYLENEMALAVCARAERQMRNPAEYPLVVITGGEPMMQDNLVGFIAFLMRQGWKQVQIESNGDRLARGFLENQYCTAAMLVVSPKIVPGLFRYNTIKEEIVQRADVLKFVIDHRSHSPYYLPATFAAAKPHDQVFLSPLTVYSRAVQPGETASAWNPSVIDSLQTMQNYAHVARLCLLYGYRATMQQHLFFMLP